MIELAGLTKVFGRTVAVDDLTCSVEPGMVTGFLGPNGAGKTTTMRLILGLDHPTAGTATIDGRAYRELKDPLHTVGALLDARAFHPGRSARTHLQALAATNGIGRHRVEEVLDLVGLRDVAHRRAGGFSLGMGQRLGIGAALLGDPEVVLLDEPVNGLDPDGVVWIRDLLRRLAGEGRTVFVSSHLMSEMALTADHLVLLGRGRLLADVSLAELTARADGRVLVRSPQPAELTRLLAAPGVTVTRAGPEQLAVVGRTSAEIALAALAAGVLLTELTPVHASLEDAYLAMTHADVEFPGRVAA